MSTINEHLSNIYDEGEVDQNATIRKFRIVRQEGTIAYDEFAKNRRRLKEIEGEH